MTVPIVMPPIRIAAAVKSRIGGIIGRGIVTVVTGGVVVITAVAAVAAVVRRSERSADQRACGKAQADPAPPKAATTPATVMPAAAAPTPRCLGRSRQ